MKKVILIMNSWRVEFRPAIGSSFAWIPGSGRATGLRGAEWKMFGPAPARRFAGAVYYRDPVR